MDRKKDLVLRSPSAKYLVTTPERSRAMAAVKSYGNKTTETQLAAVLREYKIRGWRRHYSVLGKPDFVFLDTRLAVFVDGCFWHGCPKCYRLPNANRRFWRKKLAYNTFRDRRITMVLRKSGWKVLRFWEHELKDLPRVAERIRAANTQRRRHR